MLRSLIALSILCVSLALLTLQLWGLVQPGATHAQEGTIEGYNFATQSQEGLLDSVRNGTGLVPGSSAYADYVTNIAFSSLQHGAAAALHPAHSWVGWTLSRWYGESLMFTQDPRVIAESGFAVCSQAARVVTEIARRDGVEARLVGLDGHVVSELLINGAWLMSDPDYGIVFLGAVDEVGLPESEPQVRASLSKKGFTSSAIDEYLEFFRSSPPVRRENWSPDEAKPWIIERWGVALSWLAPSIGFGVGFLLLRR